MIDAGGRMRAVAANGLRGLTAAAVLAAPAQAQTQPDFDPIAGLTQAIADCAAFVDAESVDGAPEPPSEIGDLELYIWTEERAALGLTLEFTHSPARSLGSTPLPAGWQCRIEGIGPSHLLWRGLGVADLFADLSDILPNVVAGEPEDGRWAYHDCTDPANPVEHRYRLYEKGQIAASIQTPALDALACQQVTPLQDLLFACVYEFAKGPWDRIRDVRGDGLSGQVTIHHRATLEEIAPLAPPDPQGWRIAEVETDYGPVTIARAEGEMGRCLVDGVPSAPGVTGARYGDFAEAVDEFVLSASTFYDGAFFRSRDGAPVALLTCAESFPNTAIVPTPAPDGLVVIFEPTDDPAFLALCEGG